MSVVLRVVVCVVGGLVGEVVGSEVVGEVVGEMVGSEVVGGTPRSTATAPPATAGLNLGAMKPRPSRE